MSQQAMPWGAKNGDRRPDWETPTVLFREIERRYAHGGRFTVDVCAELAAEGVTADPLQLIAELGQ